MTVADARHCLVVPATDAKVRLRGISKRFVVKGRPVDALCGVDLEVCVGEFVCIVGPSGCGKTTILRIVAGLDRQSAGSVEIRQQDARARPLNSMVFQGQSIFPWMNVRDNVAFGLKAQGIPRRERYRIAEPFIRKVGLTGFEDALPHQLSGGMQQRVSIARAFANDPEILLMDEPFASLDEQTKLILQGELLRIWEESHKTVLYVTHSIDEAMFLGDRIIVLSSRPGRVRDVVDVGRIIGRARTVEELKSHPRYGELFSGVWAQLRDEVETERALAEVT